MSHTWTCQPTGGVRWEASQGRIDLVTDDGNPIRTLERRPDGTWLESVGDIAFAPDGTAAVVASSSSEWGQGTTINLYTRAGAPLRTIPVPGGGWIFKLAFDGKTILASKGPELVAFSAEGELLGQVAPAVAEARQEKEYWQPFFAPDSRQILLFRHGTHQVHRYEWGHRLAGRCPTDVPKPLTFRYNSPQSVSWEQGTAGGLSHGTGDVKTAERHDEQNRRSMGGAA